MTRHVAGLLVFAGVAWLVLRQRTAQASGGDTGPDTVTVPSDVIIGNKPIMTAAPFNGIDINQPQFTGVTGATCWDFGKCSQPPCECLPPPPHYGSISQETIPVWHLL